MKEVKVSKNKKVQEILKMKLIDKIFRLKPLKAVLFQSYYS